MINFFKSNKSPIPPSQMARNLRRFGWFCLLLQGFLGFLPIFVILIRVLFSQNRFRTSLGPFLAIAALLGLLLAMYWSFHYVRLGRKLETTSISRVKIIRTLWLGLNINIVGMICAVFIAMGKIGILTLNLLRLPQGATVITSGARGDSLDYKAFLTPSDLIMVQAMICTIAAELVGIIIALLLMHQITRKTT
ncbi:DUF3611 family protein [Gloeocapsa sp. PCC 73106]|uniref:DUF3611 family protein n=1 Tax=Gloeocapsa sp. PCC 73106 TaxID=102232 RepID=UPI0002AC0F30|nr:DUF3611 family protein [Gloeocapsa sp. PCC 73106]ELR99426.1 Protein of unknown function (DUF3611) [Gloeocapsa sp. PCC 73106]